MKAVYLTENDLPEIESFLRSQDFVPIQQTPVWGEFQLAALGSHFWRLGVRDTEGKLVAYAQVFGKRWPLGMRWLQVPRGPLVIADLGSQIAEVSRLIFDEIKKLTEKEKAVFVRFDFQKDIKLEAKSLKLKASHQTNFPETTLVLDLTQTEEQILAQMKPKGRYNIKVAQKHGIRVRQIQSKEAAKIFYELLQKTTARDGFSGHPQNYYEKFLEVLGKDVATCFVAEQAGKPLAASLCTFYGDTATYYYGASDHEYRNRMAPYLVQWRAIQEAKKRGCKYYDFLGIAPEGTEKHSLSGVTDFKKKFGGEVVSYPKSQELILKDRIFRVIKLIKKIV